MSGIVLREYVIWGAHVGVCVVSFAVSTRQIDGVISGSTVRRTSTMCSGLHHLLVLSEVRQVQETSHRLRMSATIAASAAFCVGYGPEAENWPCDIPGVSVSITQNCEQVADGQSPPVFFLGAVFGFDVCFLVFIDFSWLVVGMPSLRRWADPCRDRRPARISCL